MDTKNLLRSGIDQKFPLVTVIIPFYSGVQWLKEAICSVVAQTFKAYEILLIVDGAKEDLTFLSEESVHKEITVIYKDNGGPASARNLGIAYARGKYIAFLDSDDLWYPNKLEIQFERMENANMEWSQHSYEYYFPNSSN